MPWNDDVTDPFVIPAGAGPGEARVIIGSEVGIIAYNSDDEVIFQVTPGVVSAILTAGVLQTALAPHARAAMSSSAGPVLNFFSGLATEYSAAGIHGSHGFVAPNIFYPIVRLFTGSYAGGVADSEAILELFGAYSDMSVGTIARLIATNFIVQGDTVFNGSAVFNEWVSIAGDVTTGDLDVQGDATRVGKPFLVNVGGVEFKCLLGTQVFNFAAVAAVTGNVDISAGGYANPPFFLHAMQAGSNRDVCSNVQGITATTASMRIFQSRLVAFTDNVTLTWLAIGL